MFVCLSVCLHSNRNTAWAINTKFVHMYSVAVAQHALSQRSKIKDQGHTVWKLSWRMVASYYIGCPIILCYATCGHCRRGSACRYDCLCFLVLPVDCLGHWLRWTWLLHATWTVTVYRMCLSPSVVLTTSSISHHAMQDATTLLLIKRCVIPCGQYSSVHVSQLDIVVS